MPMLIADHHLKDVDEWIKIFSANPPPSTGSWRLMRGSEDSNRVYVIGEFTELEAGGVRAFFEWRFGTGSPLDPRQYIVPRSAYNKRIVVWFFARLDAARRLFLLASQSKIFYTGNAA